MANQNEIYNLINSTILNSNNSNSYITSDLNSILISKNNNYNNIYTSSTINSSLAQKESSTQ